ncbi:hypothetical protein CY35_03G138300 [Sphagnum magellanicum]|nr:hypothetical protein CY35_03G138300 [Sphagnum magellanicum]
MAQASTFQVLFYVAELAIGIGGLFVTGWSLHLSRVLVRARTERTATVETGNTDQAELGDHADIEARAQLDGVDAKDASALPTDGVDAKDASALPTGDLEDGLPNLEMGKLT